MLFVILAILGMLALLDKTLRLDRRQMLRAKTEFELARLHHQLFMNVLDGIQPGNKWAVYAEKLVLNTKPGLSFAPVWVFALVVVGLDLVAKEQKEEQAAFERALLRAENRSLAEIYLRYQAAMHSFLSGRLPLLFWLTRRWRTVSDRVAKAEKNMPAVAVSKPELPLVASILAGV
jgi:hypothetical protein